MAYYYSYYYSYDNSIQTEVARQSQGMGYHNFICALCVNYEGGYSCKQRIFIAFTGANTSNCRFYQKGTKCPHCGKYIRGD